MLFWEAALQYILSIIAHPLGFISIVLVVLLAFAGVSWPWVKWLGLGLIFTVVSFNPAFMGSPFPGVLEGIRQGSRPLVLLGLILMVPSSLFSRKDQLHPAISVSIVGLMALHFVSAMSRGYDGEPFRALLELTIVALIFVTFIVGVVRWCINDDRNVDRALIALTYGGCALICLNVYLALLFSYTVFEPGNARLFGTAGNPQHTGAAIAMTVPLLLYGIVTRWKNPVLVALFGALLATAFLLILWTGSRTAGLMSVVSILLFFRTRIVSFALVGVVSGIAIYFILPLFSGVNDVAYRMTDTTDTRTGVWMLLLQDFWQNPYLGKGRLSVTGSENSYLLIAASMGMLGVVPMLIAVFGALVIGQRMIRSANSTDASYWEHSAIVAGLACVFVASTFDPHLLNLFGPVVLTFYLYLSLSTYCLWRARFGQASIGNELSQQDAEDYSRSLQPVQQEISSY